MRYSITVSSAPPAEPVTLAEAKLHLRVASSDTDQDTLISALIQGAREWVENYCRRSLVQRTLIMRMDAWPGDGLIRLPRGPVQSVTGITANGSTVSASIYETDLYAVPARVRPVSGSIWPSLTEALNAVAVTYVAGYAPGATSPTDYAENVPAAIKAAIKLIIGHLYENRESVVVGNVQVLQVPQTVLMLLAPYEIRDFRLE